MCVFQTIDILKGFPLRKFTFMSLIIFRSSLFRPKILRVSWNNRFESIYFEGEDKCITLFITCNFTQNQSEKLQKIRDQVTGKRENRQPGLVLGCMLLRSYH